MENTNKLLSGKGTIWVVKNASRGLLYQARCMSKSVTSVVWEVYVKLHPKDLTDYFENCPLLKGSTMRFLINSNKAEVSLTPKYCKYNISCPSVWGNAFPLMVTSLKTPTGTASGGKNTFGTNADELSVDIVLVVPYFSASANGGMNLLLLSYRTAGAKPDPNIMLSGVNLFLENSEYYFCEFSHQLASSNELNRGLTTGLGSGLIGMLEFENLYRYYHGNASRSLPGSEGGVPQTGARLS